MEAQAGSSRKDFVNYIYYALKSANETVFWLELIKDTENINISEIESLHRECVELTKILGSSLVTLKKN
jgi:four helix bundle protein